MKHSAVFFNTAGSFIILIKCFIQQTFSFNRSMYYGDYFNDYYCVILQENMSLNILVLSFWKEYDSIFLTRFCMVCFLLKYNKIPYEIIHDIM